MSFNLHRWFRDSYLNEEKGFEKGSWEYLTNKEKSEFADEIFALIDNAYAPLGGNPNYQSPSNVDGSEGAANYLVIDFDDDPEFDAVVVDKRKYFIRKL